MLHRDKAARPLPEGSGAGIHSRRSGGVWGRAPLRWTDYVFCLVVGSAFIFALTRTIFSATFISIDALRLYTTGLVAIMLFMIITYNLATRIVAGSVALIFGLYVLNAIFRHPPYRPDGETFPRVIEHFYELLLMAGGSIPYDQALGRTAVWLVCLAFGFVVVIFMLHIFSFYVLALTGIAVFAFTWAPGFVRDDMAFFVFLFAICVILIRKMNRSALASLVIVPLCALVVFFSQRSMPTESDAFIGRPLTQFVSETIEDVSDRIFELFNPTYFSFATTGFSGSGGTLGGPVNPNSRPVMEVRAPGGTYLAGITHNVYTGNRWVSDLEEGDIYTHGLPHGEFEMLEAFASLLRGATIAREEPAIMLNDVRSLFRTTAAHNIGFGDFYSFGIMLNGGYYLHTYMPTSAVEVDIGRRRTGTVFRPGMGWGLEFAATGGDYLHVLDTLPAGDLQAPRLMSRNTGYQMQFLNVNQNLPFIQQLLREADRGVYTRRATHDESSAGQRHVTFYGAVEGLITPPEYFVPDDFSMFWPDVRDYNIINAIAEFYYDYEIVFSPERHRINIASADGQHQFALDFHQWMQDPWLPAMRQFAETESFGIAQMQTLFDVIIDPAAHVYFPHEVDLLNILDAFTANVLQEYAYQIRQHFMDVPYTVPQRVHDLTFEIIQDANTDFDKIMAIRDYLLEFPYTFNTVPVPQGVCFVDHFLFTGQQGYCVYFASAMAVMARIAGVPSRYVEGFVTPATYTYREHTVITNMMAHAWVEVYLEGFGWLKVEATPTYAYLQDAGFPAPRQMRQHMTGDWDEFDWWYYEEMMMMELMQQGLWTPGMPTPGTAATINEQEQGGIMGELQERINPIIFAIAIPALALLAVLGYALIRVLQVWGGKKRVSKLDTSGQIVAYFTGIIDIISYFSLPVAAGQTPLGYGLHYGKRFTFCSDSVILGDLVDLYYKAKYSHHSIKEDERALMQEAYFEILAKLKWQNTRTKYLQLRYIQRVGVIGLSKKVEKSGDKKVTLRQGKVTI